ncbi:hypothetical protein NLY43_25500 [Mesorhizobium sp. C416B]|uniref:hypothetical protein n=1 Tax=unclassified Mesorhizobium TaxID=325217 RepID=UPI0003CF6523|nr:MULTISPECIES: hypothetical protein [unclassified Mesorhizobium]ESX49435.1 hypothetical protein X762_12295 [Mesorhizobium sp. LSHC426A00]ESX56250.1 hypothetical protein X761_12685 [Mesorhizobium sp. LSHC424B00]ESX73097.1 hypothetical protein X758_12015 [Mesorhizobium sp. LSHC416B00]WJI61930.1 hypothetical protein NLY43_25500 [Mesorhizobium sp. C416B]
MDERITRALSGIEDFEHLAQLEANIRRQNAFNDEVAQPINQRSAYLGRTLVAERTGLDLSRLTPAQERIVEAVSAYVGVMKHQGKEATRTFLQLRNRGLIEAAETAVAKAKPTQGFQVLKDEDPQDLSYEQIILDHPAEFSLRAAWYARRTLGLPNDEDRPPRRAKGVGQSNAEVPRATVETLERDAGPITQEEAPYWVLVCNPAKWAIDRFFESGITYDTWGVRPSDQHSFAPGQLGIVRVGVDRRSTAERDGRPPLEPGIYARAR